jgi:nucleoside-diphosphate-sugar epimerase
MKIILSGSTGFVGQNLIKYIEEKEIGISISLNLREDLPEQLETADAIIHLAGKAHDLKNASDPQEYFEVNYGKTKDLFDLFLQSDIKDFIYFSSVKAVADTVEGILKEDTQADPKTPYGQSKLQAEEYLLSKTLPEGKRLIILRPCMIHGPGNKGNLNLLYQVVKKGIPYPLGAFENKRSFLSIDNLNFIIHQILTNTDFPSGVYNVADDRSLSTNELIKIIAEASGTRGRVWKLPKRLIVGLAKTGDVFRLPLNSERLKKLTESYVVSNEKVKNALGVQEFPVSSIEGLMKTIRSF